MRSLALLPVPRFFDLEQLPFGIAADSASTRLGNEHTVRIARIDQRHRIENGSALVAAALLNDNQFNPCNLRLDEQSTANSVERQLHSNHSEREPGNPLWQHVSFFDGSELGFKFADFAKGVTGRKKSDPFIIVAELQPARIGVRYRGEPLLQAGLLENELVCVEPISELDRVWSSLTDLTL